MNLRSKTWMILVERVEHLLGFVHVLGIVRFVQRLWVEQRWLVVQSRWKSRPSRMSTTRCPRKWMNLRSKTWMIRFRWTTSSASGGSGGSSSSSSTGGVSSTSSSGNVSSTSSSGNVSLDELTLPEDALVEEMLPDEVDDPPVEVEEPPVEDVLYRRGQQHVVQWKCVEHVVQRKRIIHVFDRRFIRGRSRGGARRARRTHIA
jgi:hypothetical protein